MNISLTFSISGGSLVGRFFLERILHNIGAPTLEIFYTSPYLKSK